MCKTKSKIDLSVIGLLCQSVAVDMSDDSRYSRGVMNDAKKQIAHSLLWLISHGRASRVKKLELPKLVTLLALILIVCGFKYIRPKFHGFC